MRCCAGKSRRGFQTEFRIDTGQADAVLAILGGADQWNRLWTTEGYARLKKRDTEMGRAFTDSEFREFVESADLKARRNALSTTLNAWKQADTESIGRRVGSYLPLGAKLRATVYIVIKPRSNSFVYELSTNPAIFLYLDPGKTRVQFENTVAHELHHVGLASVSTQTEDKLADRDLAKAQRRKEKQEVFFASLRLCEITAFSAELRSLSGCRVIPLGELQQI